MKKVIFLVVVLLLAMPVAYRYYLILQLRQPVLSKLVDPNSAEFKNEIYIGNWTVSGGLLCGQVNSKNKMGGYTGFAWFSGMANPDTVYIEQEWEKDLYDKSGVKRCSFEKDDLPFWWLKW